MWFLILMLGLNQREERDRRRGSNDRSRSRSKERKHLMREAERLARRIAKEEIKSRDGKSWNQVW